MTISLPSLRLALTTLSIAVGIVGCGALIGVEDPSGSLGDDAGGDATARDAALDAVIDRDAGADGDAGVDGNVPDTGADAPGPAIPTPPPDLVWYVLDEVSGTTAHDSAPHQFNITNLVGVTWDAGAIFSSEAPAGGGSANIDALLRVPPITYAAWLTPYARTDGNLDLDHLYPFPPNAVSDDVPYSGGYGIGLNVWSDAPRGSALTVEGVDTCQQAGLCVASSTQNAAAMDGGPSCTSTSNCNQGFIAGSEYFIAVTIGNPGSGGASSNAAAEVYVNGALFDETTAYIPAPYLSATNPDSSAPPSAVPPLYIGCGGSDANYGTERIFNGRIRDVRIYTRSLGAAEVQQLFLNGAQTRAPSADD